MRAELDAYDAALYGLARDELLYILDPADVYGLDFPGETFRVLKERGLVSLWAKTVHKLTQPIRDLMDALFHRSRAASQGRGDRAGRGRSKSASRTFGAERSVVPVVPGSTIANFPAYV